MLANDHRAIARRMDLFHLQEEGPGMVFWHPRGYAVYQVIEDYIRRRMRAAGFAEVRTPQVLASSLWEVSPEFSPRMAAARCREADRQGGARSAMPAHRASVPTQTVGLSTPPSGSYRAGRPRRRSPQP